MANILKDKVFEAALGVIILVNAAVISIEQSLRIDGNTSTALQVVEHIFLFIFTVELSLRLFAFGMHSIQDHWIKLDAILVFGGLINFVLELANTVRPGELAPVLALRSIRILRVVRVFRSLEQFREFYLLVRGLLQSVGMMLYTFLLMILILFLFAAVGTEVITLNHLARGPDADEQFRAHVEKYFSSMPVTLMTLMQFVTLDDMSALYRPLIEKDVTLVLYFTALILVVSIALLNLITAVVVTAAFEQNMVEKEEKKTEEDLRWKAMISQWRAMFFRLDEDKSGNLSKAELIKVSEQDRRWLCQAMEIHDPVEIFNALDVDSTGYVTIEEFCDGIYKMIEKKAPLETKRMEKQIDSMHHVLKEAQEDILHVNIQLALSTMEKQLGTVRSMLQEGLGEINVLLQDLTSSPDGLPIAKKGGGITHLHQARQAKSLSLPDDVPAWAQELTLELRKMRGDIQSRSNSHKRAASPGSGFQFDADSKSWEVSSKPTTGRRLSATFPASRNNQQDRANPSEKTPLRQTRAIEKLPDEKVAATAPQGPPSSSRVYGLTFTNGQQENGMRSNSSHKKEIL